MWVYPPFSVGVKMLVTSTEEGEEDHLSLVLEGARTGVKIDKVGTTGRSEMEDRAAWPL